MKTKISGKNLAVVIFAVLLLFIASVFGFAKPKLFQVKGNSQGSTITPTPIPYEELTIPSLRKRSYKSSLGELQTVASYADYTSYKTTYLSDGLTINGQLTIPRGDRPIEGWSAIVFVHGYIPPTQYETFKNYIAFVDYLARNKFVVFKIDLRGHGDSEGVPGGAYFSADYIIDTLNARAALQGADFVDPEKVGLWGHSMAGNVLLRSLVARPDIPATVIWGGAVYSYTDMQNYGISDNSYQPPQVTSTPRRITRQKIEAIYGKISDTGPFWPKFIPVNYLKDIKGAIQLDHTVDDPVVDIGYSRELNALLDKTSVVHELNEFPVGGHNFTGSAFDAAMEKTVEFFQKNL